MHKRAVAVRLAAMFAGCAAVVFLVMGLALYATLRSTLNIQARDELRGRADALQSILLSATDLTQWEQVARPRLDASNELGGGRVSAWTESEVTGFSHGKVPPLLVGRVPEGLGFGEVPLPERCNAITLAVHLPPGQGRPAVRLMLAKDPIPLAQTLASFETSLMVIGLAGALAVTLFGYGIARAGLAPVRRLSTQAQGLRASDPAQRLQIVGLPPELTDLTASFNGALERLEGAYKQLEGFNADVAHELRTPLTNLIGETQVALSRPRDAQALLAVLQSNLEDLERMRAIVNDMLFLARADQGDVADAALPTSLAAEAGRVIEFLEPLSEEAGLRVRLEGEAIVPADRALFCRALNNLLHNAIKHAPSGQEVMVRIEPGHGGPRISVSNPGAAIEHRQLKQLFDRFYRADPARPSHGGNHGLGLSIVKAIAAMHRGQVFARSEDGWNTFGFTLRGAA